MTIDIIVQEVGSRDGLQATNIVMPTQGKLEWIKALVAAGVSQIQVGSFVPPKLLPQLADTGEVVKAAKDIGDFSMTVLVLNLRGAQNALAAGVDQINFVMSVSEPHNLNNVRKTREESLEEFEQIVAARDELPGPKTSKFLTVLRPVLVAPFKVMCPNLMFFTTLRNYLNWGQIALALRIQWVMAIQKLLNRFTPPCLNWRGMCQWVRIFTIRAAWVLPIVLPRLKQVLHRWMAVRAGWAVALMHSWIIFEDSTRDDWFIGPNSQSEIDAMRKAAAAKNHE